MDTNLVLRPGRRGQDAVIDLEVIRRGIQLDRSFVANLVAGRDVEEDRVVIDSERGYRRAVIPLEIVARPAIRKFPDVISVVSDDVTIDLLDATFCDLIGQIL